MLESAGTDAAVPQVLFLCKRLWEGLPESDPLLKMVFARVGFLQPWRSRGRSSGYGYGNSGNRNGERNEYGKRRRTEDTGDEGMTATTTEKEMEMDEEETGDWLHQNPEIVTAVLMEMAARREEDFYHTQYNHQSPGLHQGPPGMGGYMGLPGMGMGMGMGRMDAGGRSLPSMERPWATAAGGGAGGGRMNGMPGGLGDMGGGGGGGPLPWVNHWEPIRPNTLRPGPIAHPHHHWPFAGR